jgi:secondary thiamine-phosphate synthase enzyme
VKEIKITTNRTFYDLTKEIQRLIEDDWDCKFILIHVPHTTCGVLMAENEERLIRDIERQMERLVPKFEHYFHDDIEHRPVPDHERLNAYSHLRRMLFAASHEIIPVKNGKLILGEWERIIFIDFDYGRDRRIEIYEMR